MILGAKPIYVSHPWTRTNKNAENKIKFWLPNNCSTLNHLFSAFSGIITCLISYCSPRSPVTHGFCLWENILDFSSYCFSCSKKTNKQNYIYFSSCFNCSHFILSLISGMKAHTIQTIIMSIDTHHSN